MSNPNYPSKTGRPSGGGRGNTPKKITVSEGFEGWNDCDHDYSQDPLYKELEELDELDESYDDSTDDSTDD